MRFFKVFFASLLAFIFFAFICVLVVFVIIGKALSPEKVVISPNGILVVETGRAYNEQRIVDPVGAFMNDVPSEAPGLYDVVRLIEDAATDDNIKGIYLKVDGNPNGFATTEELRNALLRFRQSKKFVYAYGEVMDQSAYYLATAADKIYVNPQGGVDFRGFAAELMFFKGTLDKLDITPQIFYCGKYKSATEPLRETKMTEANREQTRAFLSELYGHFLQGISTSRKQDSATLHRLANEATIEDAADALQYKLVDGLKYNDEVMDELKGKLGLKGEENVNFVTIGKYFNATDLTEGSADNKVAVIYAEGDIVTGNSDKENVIASDHYLKEIRKARQDKKVKAIVFRINSGGGSSLASEVIWRELSLARKSKPVVISMGDYAASGAYYISCAGDSIFAQPNTLTGSIGVFAILPNLQGFLNNKLGITTDRVKTAEYADMGSIGRPLSEFERALLQKSIDSTYATFKSRVVAGRRLSAGVVDSIAQGRVWSGVEAKRIGLVDRLGGLDEAINCAADMAKAKNYRLKEYPEVKSTIEKLMKNLGGDVKMKMMKEELGANYDVYRQLQRIQQLEGDIQARIPFEVRIR